MKTFLAVLAFVMAAPNFAAEFSISFKEASAVPLDGFIEMTHRIDQKIYVGPDSGIKTANVLSLELADNQGESILAITLDTAGGVLNQVFTSKLIRKQTAIIINGKVVAAPMVMSASNEHIWVSGPSRLEIEQIIESFKKR